VSCLLCAMCLCLLTWWGATPSVGEVLLLLLPPWELHTCVVPAVRDAPAFACSVGRRSFGWQGLAVAAPAWELHARIMPAVHHVLAFAHLLRRFSRPENFCEWMLMRFPCQLMRCKAC
jgi:hypothetical protein